MRVILQMEGFPCGSASKESACNVGDLGLIPGLGRSPGEGKDYPLQYSGLENSMDYSPWGCKESEMTKWLSLSSNGIWHIFWTIKHLVLVTSLPYYLLQNEVTFSVPSLNCLLIFNLWWNMTSFPALDILWAYISVSTLLRRLPWLILISSDPSPLESNMTS